MFRRQLRHDKNLSIVIRIVMSQPFAIGLVVSLALQTNIQSAIVIARIIYSNHQFKTIINDSRYRYIYQIIHCFGLEL